MPVISSADLDLLRADGHRTRVFASVLRPATLWSARVNNGSIARGATAIAFDGGSGSSFSTIAALQEVWVGTTAGGNEIGRARVRAISSGDGGVTGTLTVARNALVWADNAYLTFKHDYPLKPMFPYIDDDGIFFKDGDVAYTDQNSQPPPVVVAGPHRAGFLSGGSLTFYVDASGSYAIADGATIDSFAIAVTPASGVTAAINASSGTGHVTVTAAGYYWVRFTVTDSNGKSQLSYRCFFAHSSNPTNASYPLVDFTISNFNGNWENGGWSCNLALYDNASQADIPDKTLIVLWGLFHYGNTAATAEPPIVGGVDGGDRITFWNPFIEYGTLTGGPAVFSVPFTFTTRVYVNGQVAPAGYSLTFDFAASGGTLDNVAAATDAAGYITISDTVTGAANPGTLTVGCHETTSTILEDVPYDKDEPSPTAPTPIIAPIETGINNLLVGYLRREPLDRDMAQGVNTGTFAIETVQAVLHLYDFSVQLDAASSPAAWHQYENWLTAGRTVHHLWKWHSTLLEIADVIGLTDNTDKRPAALFEDGNLYSMAEGVTRQRGIRSHVISDKYGRVHLTYDIQLLPDDDRAALVVAAELSKDDHGETLSIVRDPVYQVAMVKTSGFAWDGSFVTGDDGEEIADVDPYCSSSPGLIPADEGESVLVVDRQTFSGQTHANQIAGRLFAQANNLYPEARLAFAGNYLPLLEPAFPEWWQIDVATTDNLREIALPDQKMALRQITADIDVAGATVRPSVTTELEMETPDGVAGYCMDSLPELGGETPVIDNDELPGALVTAGSVYYLPPNTSQWTQRTAEATSFLYQDPWWRLKQASIASADAILIRGGVGYLKRSTDGGATWSTITPGSVPAGFGGAMGDIEFIDGEGSYLAQDFHVIAARSEDSGDWESWLYVSDDDFATGTWVVIGSEGAPEVISSEVSDIIAASFVSDISAAWLRDGIYLILTQTDNGPILLLVDMSSGEPVVLDTHTPPYDTFHGPMCRLNDELALLLISTNHDSNNHIEAYTADTDGDVIALSSATTIETGDLMLSGDLMVRDSVGECAAVYARDGGDLIAQLITVDVVSEGITPGSQNVITTGVHRSVAIAYVSNTVALVSYLNDSSEEIECRRVILTPFSTSTALVVGDGINLGSSNLTISGPRLVRATNSSNYFLLAWIEPDYDLQFALIDGSASPPTVADTATGPAARRQPAVARLADNQFAVLYAKQTSEAVYSRTLSVSGSTLTDNNDEFLLNSDTGSSVFDLFVHNLDGALVAFVGIGPNLYAFHATFPAISGGVAKALGLSIGRGLGELCYLTLWNGVQIILKSYLLPDGTDDGTILLGLASEEQVDDREIVVYPLAAWGDDTHFYLFGRFNGPGGIGFPAHLTYSDDYGVTWTAVETGFGDNHVGALWELMDGRLLTIRNLAGQAKLYAGDAAGLTVQSTLPFAAQVNPRALAVDWIDEVVVACSASGLSIMVAVSAPPYAAWTDLTANHGTAGGVKSVAIL